MASTVFIIAGEVSGDIIGARLIEAIARLDSSVQFVGVGGDRMIKAGLQPLFHMKEVSAIGLVEVLSKLPIMFKKLCTVNKSIEDIRPKALVTIDFPDSNNRVAKKAKKLGIPAIRYVAPQVWAWRPRRAQNMTKFADCLLALFKFEPPLFEKHGLKTVFVGHTVVEDGDLACPSKQEVDGFFKKYNITKSYPLVCLLPGSRLSEIRRHTPIFLNAVKMLKHKIPDLQVFIPTFDDYLEYINKLVDETWIKIGTNHRDKGIAMRTATCALAASGTVTLELAYTETPAVIAYQVNPITAFIVKKLIKIKHVSLVNILLKQAAIPEFLQKDCSPKALCNCLSDLIANKTLRDSQCKSYKKVLAELALPNAVKPSDKAAACVLDFIHNSTLS
ncbi:MAG: lipid-A-disaccharide synthase [Holosporales bacterium]|nr:lipid-A-disaccharide synthase [Holosporales bacterium]